MGGRDTAQRKQDALAALARERDAWVASADATGEVHLIPLSYYWDGVSLTMATPEKSKTTRNLIRAGRARVALPSTDDVVIVEGPVEIVAIDREPQLGDAHAAATGFDARLEPEPYVYLRLTPATIQTWRDAAELTGRTVMRDGAWRGD
jgi:hypothetical protein